MMRGIAAVQLVQTRNERWMIVDSFQICSSALLNAAVLSSLKNSRFQRLLFLNRSKYTYVWSEQSRFSTTPNVTQYVSTKFDHNMNNVDEMIQMIHNSNCLWIKRNEMSRHSSVQRILHELWISCMPAISCCND